MPKCEEEKKNKGRPLSQLSDSQLRENAKKRGKLFFFFSIDNSSVGTLGVLFSSFFWRCCSSQWAPKCHAVAYTSAAATVGYVISSLCSSSGPKMFSFPLS